MQGDQRPAFPTDHNAPAEWEVLNALIGEIYDSVLHPESWNETLARITGTLCPLNWDAAFILWENSNPPSARFVAATGLAAGIQEIYTAVYAGHHPWSRKFQRYGNGSVVDSFDIMTREEFYESEFFRNFLKPYGIDPAWALPPGIRTVAVRRRETFIPASAPVADRRPPHRTAVRRL